MIKVPALNKLTYQLSDKIRYLDSEIVFLRSEELNDCLAKHGSVYGKTNYSLKTNLMDCLGLLIIKENLC